MNLEIEARLSAIKNLKEDHYTLGLSVLKAGSGNFYAVDSLAVAVINRSLANSNAIDMLVRDKNYLSAASLIRLQLDSCLRFYATFLVDNPHEFANEVLGGEHIRKIKDRNGKKMSDRYLVEQLSKDHRWMTTVYERTSGFIHFSNKHIVSSMDLDGNGAGSIQIGPGPENIPSEYWDEMLECFIETTKILLAQVGRWKILKEQIS